MLAFSITSDWISQQIIITIIITYECVENVQSKTCAKYKLGKISTENILGTIVLECIG